MAMARETAAALINCGLAPIIVHIFIDNNRLWVRGYR
jgi:hypothetical protein